MPTLTLYDTPQALALSAQKHYGTFKTGGDDRGHTWFLTAPPQKRYVVGPINVFECIADAATDDENGIAHPWIAHFLVGLRGDGSWVWDKMIASAYGKIKFYRRGTAIFIRGTDFDFRIDALTGDYAELPPDK